MAYQNPYIFSLLHDLEFSEYNDELCEAYAKYVNVDIEASRAIIKAYKMSKTNNSNPENYANKNNTTNVARPKSNSNKLALICLAFAVVLSIIAIVEIASLSTIGTDSVNSTISTTATTTNKYPALDLPESGEIIITTDKPRNSKITIHNSSSNCFIKLKDYNLNDVFGFFVKSGDSITINVPQGDFYVYFAYGDAWYGKSHLFGDDTECQKDDELQNFSDYTLEYTLYPVNYGNFTPDTIDIDEF